MSRPPMAVVLIVLAGLVSGCAELTAGLNAPVNGAPTPPVDLPSPEPEPTVAEPPPSPPVVPAPPEAEKPEPNVVQAVTESVPAPPAMSATPPAEGRVIAKVGAEVVTLPQLTSAVKARLADSATTDPDRQPTRKQIVRLARSTLEARIVASLVDQEARRVLGPSLDATAAAIETRWQSEELPSQLQREGAPSEPALHSTLAARGRSLDEEREAYRVRALAAEVRARASGSPATRLSDREFHAYLDTLRERFPVESVLTARQVAAAAGDPQARETP